MYQRFLAAGVVLALVTACGGGGTSSVPSTAQTGSSAPAQSTTRASAQSVIPNVVVNPGFETGTLSPWTSCGSVSGPATTTAKANSGTYSVLLGATAKPEVNGTKAVCQTVTVPAAGSLSFYVYEGTNDTISYVDQEADILSASGTVLKQLYSEAKSTGAWVQKTFDLSAYAGQTVQLYFGVKGNGYASDYVYEYLDDVSLTGTSSSPTPSPSPTATATATASPTAKPSASPSPTSSPTAAPTATPTAAFTCNDAQFTTYQNEFAAGSISADQFVDICGPVTQVLAKKKTSSGTHGYFYIEMPSGYQIEIVSNLDAMAEASTDRPPTTWPWIAVGQYAYVQGRYYYDSSSSQGVDWTEDDTSSSWEHVGYVAVCNSSGASCSKYW